MHEVFGTVNMRLASDELDIEVSEQLFHDFYVAYHEQKTVNILNKEYRVMGATYPRRGTRHYNVILKLIPLKFEQENIYHV